MAKKILKPTIILLSIILILPIITFTPNIKAEDNKNILKEKTKLTTSSFYVSTKGSDITGDGSIFNPWRTIQKAANMVSAGDTVNVRGGTYYEQVNINNKHGTSSQWITFRPYSTEVVTIDGTYITPSYYNGIFYITYSSYIRITGFNIHNSAYGGIHIMHSDNNIEIDHNHVKNISARGIVASTENSAEPMYNIHVHHNVVDNVNNDWSGYGGEGGEALSFGDVQFFEIDHNKISRCGKEIIDVKSGCSNGKVHHNIIDTSTWEGDPNYGGGIGYGHIGIYIDAYDLPQENIEIYNNYIFGDHGPGIIITGEMGGRLKNIKAYNNVINLSWAYANAIGCFKQVPGALLNSFEDIIFHSNTIYTTSSTHSPIKFSGDLSQYINAVELKNNIVTSNNAIVFDVTSFVYNSNKISLTNNLFWSYNGKTQSVWNGVVRQEFGDKAIIQNPLFISLPNDFHLQGASPAIDAGTTVPIFFDYDDNHRQIGSEYDLGAYEYVDNNTIMIIKPVNAIYVLNRARAPFFIPLIVGSIDIEVNIPNGIEIKRVEFYIDGELISSDNTFPFNCTWNKQKMFKSQKFKHMITVAAYDTNENLKSHKIITWKIF